MNLKTMRLSKGIKQRELAESIGISEMVLSLIENNQVLPKPETLQKIALKLECNIEDIYTAKELKLLKAKKTTVKGDYNLHGRLDEFDKNVIYASGFKSINSWINDCYTKLKNEEI